MTIFPLRTRRCTLRVMRPDDADVLAGYRSDPEVARYQDWDLPYTVDMARAMLAGQAELDDVQPGTWVQIAVERSGTVVGDVAVGLDPTGAVATIGYTLAPGAQGQGIAREAVEAMVDALLADGRVHRIVATLDPQNHASMRVIEPLGFVHEGTARESELIRGEWMDDARFALLRSDRDGWLGRATAPPDVVELVEITPSLLGRVSRLATFKHQERFVAPMAASLAQALVPPGVDDDETRPVVPWFRAIVADGEVAGFVMVSWASDHEPVPFLWRLLIDRTMQRRGIGERAVTQLADLVRGAGHPALMVSWVDAPGGPRPFYERLGFVPTGELDGEEVVARLDLGGPSG